MTSEQAASAVLKQIRQHVRQLNKKWAELNQDIIERLHSLESVDQVSIHHWLVLVWNCHGNLPDADTDSLTDFFTLMRDLLQIC